MNPAHEVNRKLNYDKSAREDINNHEAEIYGNDTTVENPGLVVDERERENSANQHQVVHGGFPNLLKEYLEQLVNDDQLDNDLVDPTQFFLHQDHFEAAYNSFHPKRSTPGEKKSRKTNVISLDELRYTLMSIDSSYKDTAAKISVMCDKVIDVMSAVENSIKSFDR